MVENKDLCSVIFNEHEQAVNYKCCIGRKGIYEQAKQNRRFYIGDQWYGAKVGNDRPLARHNVIKRIGEYKMSVVGADNCNVSYSANGISNTKGLNEDIAKLKENLVSGKTKSFQNISNEEINLVMNGLSSYFDICARRIHFDDICNNALKNAYIAGTGVVYTYWDNNIKTGQYADEAKSIQIMGDIVCEVLDIEDVDFSDPNDNNVQNQSYIIVSQRKTVGELIREARANGISEEVIEKIKPDDDYFTYDEAIYSKKATVLTKFYKEYNDDGSFVIKAVRVCKNATIKNEWNTGLHLYPIAIFNWEQRANCIYGDSEITYLIPNQIAINRMLTASVWAVMVMGMPIMVVNGDVIHQPITNNPGQIISFCGNSEDFDKSVKYISPPDFSPNFDKNITSMIQNTLAQAGASEAALGELQAQNTSAINAVREAATMPLNIFKKRYLSFVEEIAKIWADFYLNMYGRRYLKQVDENGTWYMPFDSERYNDLIINVKVDSTSSATISQSLIIEELNNLYEKGAIDTAQYLERLPKGVVPDVTNLVREVKKSEKVINDEG